MFKDIVIPKGNHTAIVNRGLPISYDDLNVLIEKKSSDYVKLGILPGHHVSLYMKDQFELLISYLALWNMGATLVMLDPQISHAALSILLENSESHYIQTDLSPPKISGYSLLQDDEIALFKRENHLRTQLQTIYGDSNRGFVMLFTSGSQGTPKAVTLKKLSILNNMSKVREYLKLSHQDKTLMSLPLSYSYAMSQALGHLTAGATIVFEDQTYLVDKIMQVIERDAITNYAATPYFYQSLNTYHKSQGISSSQLSSLRIFMNAGGYLSPQIIEDVLKALPNLSFFNNYGQTEASPRLCYAEFRADSTSFVGVGYPLPGIEFKIEDDEICYRSEDIMLGYYGAFNEDLACNWFKTGDTGSLQNGRLIVTGRKDSMIKINGRKVHLNRVEDIIYAMGGIKHIHMSKEYHALYGEYLVANVVPAIPYPNEEKFKKLIRAYVRSQLSASERPQKILISQDVSVNSNGKITSNQRLGNRL